MKSMIAVAVLAFAAIVAADVSELTGGGGPSNQYLPPNQGGQGGFGRQGFGGQSPLGQGFGGQGQGFGGQGQGFGGQGRQGFGGQGPQGFGGQGPQGFGGQGPQGSGGQGCCGQGSRGQGFGGQGRGQGFGGQGRGQGLGGGSSGGFGPERDYLPPTQNGEPAPAHTFGADGYRYRNPNQF